MVHHHPHHHHHHRCRLIGPPQICACAQSVILILSHSSEYFIVELITPIEFENKDFQVDIFNMTGSLIKSRFATEGQKISVSDLAVGVYNVVIKKEGLRTESEVFVKMK